MIRADRVHNDEHHKVACGAKSFPARLAALAKVRKGDLQRIRENLGGLREADPVFALIAPVLRFVPFEANVLQNQDVIANLSLFNPAVDRRPSGSRAAPVLHRVGRP